MIDHRDTAIDRRAFVAAAGGWASLALGAGTTAFATTSSTPSEIAASFATARQKDLRLTGFDNAVEFAIRSTRVEGSIPKALHGTFYRNGPALFERDGVRYRHWFDGDGFLQRWGIGPSGVSYLGRFIGTQKHTLEEKAGQFLLPTSGGGIPVRAPLTSADHANPSNTSVIEVDGTIWALWEGGSAVKLDPTTIDTLGYIDLGQGTKSTPFGAHPRVGADGRIWNFGSFGSRVILHKLDRFGRLEKFKVHPLGQEGYCHDFVLTGRSVVLVQCSTGSDGSRSIENGSFGSIRGFVGKPMKVHVFDRETLQLTREAELPSGFAFHFGNGWEDADGTIHFDICHSANGDQMLEFFKPMLGQFPRWQSRICRVALPVKGAVSFEELHPRVEFPTFNPSYRTEKNRYVYAACIDDRNGQDWFDSVAKIDLESGKSEIFGYGADWMVEEHVFVPNPASADEDDGWVIGTALNWKKQRTALTIFDARQPQRGYLARAWLDRAMPLGLHGHFVRQ